MYNKRKHIIRVGFAVTLSSAAALRSLVPAQEFVARSNMKRFRDSRRPLQRERTATAAKWLQEFRQRHARANRARALILVVHAVRSPLSHSRRRRRCWCRRPYRRPHITSLPSHWVGFAWRASDNGWWVKRKMKSHVMKVVRGSHASSRFSSARPN